MSTTFEINVVLRSGREVLFKDIVCGTEYSRSINGVAVYIGTSFPAPVEVTPENISDPVASIEYNMYSDMRNFYQVIVPDCGRQYDRQLQMTYFFRFQKDSAVNDIDMPIYIFKGQDMYTALAFGIVGDNYETSFKVLEPSFNRALVVYMRRLSLQIKRGTEMYPIPSEISQREPDGRICEYLYFKSRENDSEKESWFMTMRDFAGYQKQFYNLPDVSSPASMHPLWCSWTDWFSDDVTEQVIIDNVREGVKLGIKNYIIDDGWFGPGLDNDYDVELNIGDWQPDPLKIKDMKKLVSDIKASGAYPLIWCAPHAVAKGAECFPVRKKYIIADCDGKLFETHNKFHSLCFMNPEAREIMAEICTRFIVDWDFDGAKYDLFNCVPNMICENPEHEHDVSSMVEGLNLTLKLIFERTRALKKDYITELKQNYATPFLSRWGTMTRAGDTPYCNEGNFYRTIYVQSYTPYSVNDYQTITNLDTPEEAAVIVLKMIAAGIPAYSIDFARLNQRNKDVIAHYNGWYNSHLELFNKYREPQDANLNVIKTAGEHKDYFFVINEGLKLNISRSSVIFNATGNDELFINAGEDMSTIIKTYDCFGNVVESIDCNLTGWNPIPSLQGGMITIDFLQGD